MNKPKKMCYNCAYRGDIFKIPRLPMPHCHCEHESRSHDSGWGTLEDAFSKACDKYVPRPNKEAHEHSSPL